MTTPEKTGIYTLEQAIAQMAESLTRPKVINAARAALAAGCKFETVLTIKNDSNGVTVTTNLYSIRKCGSLGTLIRLTDEGAFEAANDDGRERMPA